MLPACSSSSNSAAARSNANATLLSKAVTDYYSGRLELARSEFQTLVEQDRNNKYAWYSLGAIAQYSGDTKTAANDYEKALAIDAAYEPALYNSGVLAYAARDWRGAIAWLDKAVAANPNDASAHWDLGLALAHLHTKAGGARSKKELNIAVRLNPSLVPRPGGSGSSGVSGPTGAQRATGTTG